MRRRGDLDWLDLAERVQILVLPLVDAHVELFPFALEGFICQLLPHLGYRQVLKQLLVLDQIVVHVDQLFLDLLHINDRAIFNESDLIFQLLFLLLQCDSLLISKTAN